MLFIYAIQGGSSRVFWVINTWRRTSLIFLKFSNRVKDRNSVTFINQGKFFLSLVYISLSLVFFLTFLNRFWFIITIMLAFMFFYNCQKKIWGKCKMKNGNLAGTEKYIPRWIDSKKIRINHSQNFNKTDPFSQDHACQSRWNRSGLCIRISQNRIVKKSRGNHVHFKRERVLHCLNQTKMQLWNCHFFLWGWHFRVMSA